MTGTGSLANVNWLERAQIKLDERSPGRGRGTITDADASRRQLQHPVRAPGLECRQRGWTSPSGPKSGCCPRTYFEHLPESRWRLGLYAQTQAVDRQHDLRRDLQPDHHGVRGDYEGLEYLQGESIRRLRQRGLQPQLGPWHRLAGQPLRRASELRQRPAMARSITCMALERAGRLSGVRFFGQNDWYRLGAEELVQHQNKLSGFWQRRRPGERDGGDQLRAAVPGQGPRAGLDQQAQPRSRAETGTTTPTTCATWSASSPTDWKHLLDLAGRRPRRIATIQDMLQAPIVFFNGHTAPGVFGAGPRQNLRSTSSRGASSSPTPAAAARSFDAGLQAADEGDLPRARSTELRPLPPEHPVWRAKHLLSPEIHPLWGIEHGCRTVVIYSPQDLSCYWNQVGTQPDQPGGDQGDQGRPERHRLRHGPRDAGRQAGGPRGRRLQG